MDSIFVYYLVKFVVFCVDLNWYSIIWGFIFRSSRQKSYRALSDYAIIGVCTYLAILLYQNIVMKSAQYATVHLVPILKIQCWESSMNFNIISMYLYIVHLWFVFRVFFLENPSDLSNLWIMLRIYSIELI